MRNLGLPASVAKCGAPGADGDAARPLGFLEVLRPTSSLVCYRFRSYNPAALTSGTRLGVYEITAAIGKGHAEPPEHRGSPRWIFWGVT